ncbi:MAG: type II toxin-antitoxin system RelE/ParE family toxin [Anaerolineaceae bacterium]|nr:type II toxin-antitoxin system RelE/ParE family toxin [Anaerolineaceae bacterium]
MILSFSNSGTEDIFNGENTKAARNILPVHLNKIAARKFDQLQAAVLLKDLAIPAGNNLKPLDKDRAGQHSIRINDQYRICFYWKDNGPEQVEITDYHS